MAGFNLDGIERMMVFGAHPDDEIIGPGGSIHGHHERGGQVAVVTFTGGGTAAASPAAMDAMIEQRRREMKAADDILGVDTRYLLQVPSQQVYGAVMGSVPVYDRDAPGNQLTLHHKLIRLIREYQPDLIFTHSPDNHRDHCGIALITSQSVFQASEAILDHLGEPHNASLVLHYSVERELEGDYSSNLVLEIGQADLDAKMTAMETQVSQTRGDYLQHFKDMMQGRALLWGAKHFGAGRYAEPFHVSGNTPIRIALGR
ncbi:hypothetical protein COY28_04800 [Candidatus Woesearchaeota archaeon CG_4_10_14_0_2_um_filter_57_5]|nr:MAG: hypothetical protein AUJ68_06950 [Candidatus Woesearchaeota archaeon CG1_02_57_44]PIZ51812.1 MAG: hypothetical protein COY28_04800 [Candidatus Woesearchaeota archaeon CG_4_10_14_0_2_um_filter_57_5]